MVLHYPTVKPSLRKALAALMHVPELASFRLVGGTALSLQLGHRLSVDIDLFSDALYKTIDHDGIESAVSRNVGSLSSSMSGPLGVGKCFDLVFENDQVIKLDLFLTEPCSRNSPSMKCSSFMKNAMSIHTIAHKYLKT